MKKKNFLLLFIVCGALHVSAQTLFTYGQHTVDAKDFLRAYKKNNPGPVANKAKSVREYLDLYISSKLKVQEAYARGMDTIPSLLAEVANLRNQIVDNYMTDPEILNRMVKEAFTRSQKDIRVAHIFISFKNVVGIADMDGANQKKQEVLEQIKKGVPFSQLAEKYSNDPDVKNNKGEIGYITVFTLPYEFENAIYKTPAGKTSEVVTSQAGFHIFKNLGERKAAGKIKAQQILIALPPGADEAAKKRVSGLADSLYKRILKGDDFGKLATAFSNDYISAAAGGNLPDIGVGQFEPAFENTLRSIPKNGGVGKPFLTSHGWHIVKKLSEKPVVTNAGDKANLDELKQKVMADGRWKNSGNFIFDAVKNNGGYQKMGYSDAALKAYTDSLLDMLPMAVAGKTINENTVLIKIREKEYKAGEWINYARTYRFKQDGTGAKPLSTLQDEWEKSIMTNYYRDHLEEFNPEFRSQMNEFKEGNMFFEIMQQEVWNKAQNDSAALMDVYSKNKAKYTWKQSADVVMFFCSDQAIAKTVFEEIKKNPKNWRIVTQQYSEKVIGDSSRYEWDQIPNQNKMTPKEGMLTNPVVNTTDNTSSFAYIIKTYTNPMQRSFNEARGMVINDYQEQLEKQWDATLKRIYPVKIDEKVLAGISK